MTRASAPLYRDDRRAQAGIRHINNPTGTEPPIHPQIDRSPEKSALSGMNQRNGQL